MPRSTAAARPIIAATATITTTATACCSRCCCWVCVPGPVGAAGAGRLVAWLDLSRGQVPARHQIGRHAPCISKRVCWTQRLRLISVQHLEQLPLHLQPALLQLRLLNQPAQQHLQHTCSCHSASDDQQGSSHPLGIHTSPAGLTSPPRRSPQPPLQPVAAIWPPQQLHFHLQIIIGLRITVIAAVAVRVPARVGVRRHQPVRISLKHARPRCTSSRLTPHGAYISCCCRCRWSGSRCRRRCGGLLLCAAAGAVLELDGCCCRLTQQLPRVQALLLITSIIIISASSCSSIATACG